MQTPEHITEARFNLNWYLLAKAPNNRIDCDILFKRGYEVEHSE